MVTGATSMFARADEGAIADHRARFVGAVVIAGDGAGTDVDARAHVRCRRDTSDGSPSNPCPMWLFFTSHEIADVHAIIERGAGTHARKRADVAAGTR